VEDEIEVGNVLIDETCAELVDKPLIEMTKEVDDVNQDNVAVDGPMINDTVVADEEKYCEELLDELESD
jgi:hypothetical protein